ncbi:efa1/LifA-like domain protein [Escherichia coli DEC12A]|nr:efa1/LifA-like domain protein [Escherichia coli DEC12A]
MSGVKHAANKKKNKEVIKDLKKIWQYMEHYLIAMQVD